MLRPQNVPLETLVKMVAKRFVNVKSLKLDRLLKIFDEGLVTLCKLSTLTVFDIPRSGVGPMNIADMSVSSIGNPSA